jgi:hypothetical protein
MASAPDATPFVSLYADGKLRGCFGSHEGESGERVARAFLRALEDARHGGVNEGERAALVAEVSYVRDVARVSSVDEARAQFAPGTHGIAIVRAGGSPTILLPSVARDGGLGARQTLEALARKAKVADADLASDALFLFEADTVVARRDTTTERPSARAPGSLATEWLSRLVREDGFVHFGVNPRTRAVDAVGLMHHARAAVVVRALALARGGRAGDAARARAWLAADVKRALRGMHVEGWPAERERVAGTLALACLAGLPLARELLQFVGDDPLAASPWHAAQVVAALGPAAPAPLWMTCLTSLATKPWAPWTAIAAHARGDRATLERAAVVLASSVRAGAPHEGGVAETEIPELALTALTVEALAPLVRSSAAARAAVLRGQRFLERWQFRPGHIPGALDPDRAEGAFPLSPVASYARGDVTAHALLALAVAT